MSTLLPPLSFDLPAGDAKLDTASLFEPVPAAVWLEVGFGCGEHLAEQASRRPDVGFIGCEVFIDGIAALLAEINGRRLANVRLYPGDARLVLAALADASIERVFVLFPDPWPKTRHHRRRFISPGTCADLARVIRPGGELRFASDHISYVEWAAKFLTEPQNPGWRPLHGDAWQHIPDDAVPTRYEIKARRRGAPCAYLQFVRESGA